MRVRALNAHEASPPQVAPGQDERPSDAQPPAVSARSELPPRQEGEPLAEPALPADPDPVAVPALAPAASGSQVEPGEAGLDEYLPRRLLSVAPVAQQPVELLWPDDVRVAAGRYGAVLVLFIDEQGVVQRVKVESGDLPPALQELALAAFAGASFAPGQVQGVPVKSRIRVEVEFQSKAVAQPRQTR